MKSTFDDLSGKLFGDLSVVSFEGRRRRSSMWNCRCVCGTEKVVARDKLMSGSTVSCGCKRYRSMHPAETHGLSKTSEWVAWSAAKQRCYNPNNPRFKYYGGRGIEMCERWRESFEAFLSDLGPKPTSNHSIDRIDPNGNYEPRNCRWVELNDQKRNKRSSYVLYRGEEVLLEPLCHERGVAASTVRARMARGWTVEDAIDLPLQPGVRPHTPA